MARINIAHPTSLLGRHVVGAYQYEASGPVWPFSGVVECVVLPAPGFEDHHGVSIFVGGDFVDVGDCIALDYAQAAAVS
jgi:hypothetical protein